MSHKECISIFLPRGLNKKKKKKSAMSFNVAKIYDVTFLTLSSLVLHFFLTRPRYLACLFIYVLIKTECVVSYFHSVLFITAPFNPIHPTSACQRCQTHYCLGRSPSCTFSNLSSLQTTPRTIAHT